MKNILSFLLIIGCLIIVSSCNGNKKDKSSDDGKVPTKSTKVQVESKNITLDSDSLLILVKNMTKIKPYEVIPMKNDAEVIIAHRYKESNKKKLYHP